MSLDISKAKKGSMSTEVEEYSVDAIAIDSPTGEKEFSWMNSNFRQYMGYYKKISELGSAIDTKAVWTVGKGFKADVKTTAILNRIVGWGKDTFNEIMNNNVRVYQAGGDAFNEIIRKKTILDKTRNLIKKITKLGKYVAGSGELLNLKPLNPDNMKTIVNSQGMLERYEYDEGKDKPKIFKPNQIFHLAWNRIADEIHGQSIIEKIERMILMRNEAMEDQKIVFHRYVKPLWIWQLDTDVATEISSFQTKADKIVASGENLYVPKGAATAERVSVPQYSTLNPLPWIESLTQYFYQATNIPDVILGSARQTTEASGKILYLAFQQTIEKNQLFLEENIRSQLGLVVNFEFPASIAADLFQDNKKDGPVNIDKKEIQVGIKGKR